MLKQGRKRFKSSQKDCYSLNTSPRSFLSKNTREEAFMKRQLKIDLNMTDSIESDGKFSFLRMVPFTSKNSRGNQDNPVQNIKEIKIPSFFKKPSNHNKTLSNYDDQELKSQARSRQQSKWQKQNNFSSSYYHASSQNQSQIISGSPGVSEFKKLDDKLTYLQGKIQGMKVLLDKKRQEKVTFMQNQRQERASMVCSDESTRSSHEVPIQQFITQVPQHKDLHSFSQNPYSPRHSIYYVSQILRAYKQEKSLARQHLISSLEYLKMFQYTKIPDEKSIQSSKLNLPKPVGYDDKKTVIFDLDETLIHCNQNVNLPSDLKLKIRFPTGQFIRVGINIRPYARQILAALSKKFEIIVFTASHSCYANVVLDHLDPENKHIHHRLFRQHCYYTNEGIYVKDLRIINRPLTKVILVDNAAYSYAYQPLNGVPIIPYYEGNNDYELQALQKYIESLAFSYDVREKNKNVFKLNQYSKFDNPNQLVETLYMNSS